MWKNKSYLFYLIKKKNRLRPPKFQNSSVQNRYANQNQLKISEKVNLAAHILLRLLTAGFKYFTRLYSFTIVRKSPIGRHFSSQRSYFSNKVIAFWRFNTETNFVIDLIILKLSQHFCITSFWFVDDIVFCFYVLHRHFHDVVLDEKMLKNMENFSRWVRNIHISKA